MWRAIESGPLIVSAFHVIVVVVAAVVVFFCFAAYLWALVIPLSTNEKPKWPKPKHKVSVYAVNIWKRKQINRNEKFRHCFCSFIYFDSQPCGEFKRILKHKICVYNSTKFTKYFPFCFHLIETKWNNSLKQECFQSYLACKCRVRIEISM